MCDNKNRQRVACECIMVLEIRQYNRLFYKRERLAGFSYFKMIAPTRGLVTIRNRLETCVLKVQKRFTAD